MRLSKRIAVITGAGAGIGKACAREFAREGASVVIADINQAAATEAADGIVSAGGLALAVGADVSSPESVQALVRATLERYGAVTLSSTTPLFR